MSSSDPAERSGLAPRQIVGIVIAVVSLVVAQVTIPLAVLLALVFVGGMATGALVLRRRQKRGS